MLAMLALSLLYTTTHAAWYALEKFLARDIILDIFMYQEKYFTIIVTLEMYIEAVFIVELLK